MIARAEEFSIDLAVKRILNEPLSCQGRQVPVTATQPQTTYQQFPWYTRRQGLELLINNVHRRIVDGLSQCDHGIRTKAFG